MTASLLRRDANNIIKTALAGTQTKKFTDIMEAAFGGDDRPVSASTDESEEEEEDESEATAEPGASTLSKALKRKAPASSDVTKRAKLSICALKDAEAYYPNKADSAEPLHSGVPAKYFSGYYSGATTKESGYYCCYSRACKNEGQIVEDCEIFSTVKQQLSTHIRQAHLGLAVVCYVCGKRWWSASSWISHMKKVHTDLSSDEYYVSESTDTEELKIKHEVAAEDIV